MFFGPQKCLLVRRFHHFKVTANPPHEEQCLVFGKQCRCADVGERYRKLKTVVRFIDKVPITIVNETGGLVFDEFGDVHKCHRVMVVAWVENRMGKGRTGIALPIELLPRLVEQIGVEPMTDNPMSSAHQSADSAN
jgi:hypothetical protein